MTDIEIPDVDIESQNEGQNEIEQESYSSDDDRYIKEEDDDEEEEGGFANPHVFSSLDENFDNPTELFNNYQPIEKFLSREVNCLMDEISKFVMFHPIYRWSKGENSIYTNIRVCSQAEFNSKEIHYQLIYDTRPYKREENFQGNDGTEYRTVQVSATYNNSDICVIYTVMGMDNENALNHSGFNTYKVPFFSDTYMCCSRDQLEESYCDVIKDKYCDVIKVIKDKYADYVWPIDCDIYEQREIPTWILPFLCIPGVCYINYFLGGPVQILMMIRKLLHVMNICKFMDDIGPLIETPQIQIVQYFHTKLLIPWDEIYKYKFYEFCFHLLSLYLVTYHTSLYWHLPEPSVFYPKIMLLILLLAPGVNVYFRLKKYKEGKDLLMGGEQWYIENEFRQDQNKKTLMCEDMCHDRAVII